MSALVGPVRIRTYDWTLTAIKLSVLSNYFLNFHIVAFRLIFMNKITAVLRTRKNTHFISGLVL
jgi:hypothetical protein